jgi:Transposase DDE domain
VACGTRTLIDAVFGPTTSGETTYAAGLLGSLRAGMLVLADRNFAAGKLIAAIAAAKADVLVRVRTGRGAPKLPVLHRYQDGSWLSCFGGVPVRVIDAQITITTTAGRRGGCYRLATTLLDHRRYPAPALISLYHERWEHEITYLALRHTLLQGRVLRSHDPEGLNQELWALLALYQALRTAITDAVTTVAGTDPDRASYQIAVETAQAMVTQARNILTGADDLTGNIGRAVLAGLHPPRRPRVCARRIKSPLSRWNKHPPGKPRTSLRITKITTEIRTGYTPPATRRPQRVTTTSGP